MESTGVNSSVYVLTRILELYRSDSKLYTICNFKQNLLVSVNWKFLGISNKFLEYLAENSSYSKLTSNLYSRVGISNPAISAKLANWALW